MSLRDLVLEVVREVYQPRDGQPPWEWAEENIVLRADESPSDPGAYRTRDTPWHRDIMEFLNDPDYRELFIMKSSQTGVTLCVLIMIVYLAAKRPTNVMYAIDSVPEARKISKARLKPLLEDCPPLAEMVKENDDDLTNLFMMLRGMVIHIIGGGSAGQFGNKVIGLAILDELDKHPDAPQGEANTAELARSRIKKVPDGKLIGFSTPKKFEGQTNQEYLTGTRDRMFLPCPHCGHNQTLEWENVRFDHCKDMLGQWRLDEVLKDTYMCCIKCSGKILEEHKPWMLERKQVLPTNLNQDEHKRVPGRQSLHVSDLYSVFTGSTWGDMAVEFIEAAKSPSKLQHFFNSRLGLPAKERKSEVTQKEIYRLCGNYEHKCCPVMPAFTPDGIPALFVSSDVQSDVKKWVKGAFKKNGELYVIDYGQTLSFDELLAVQDEEVTLGSMVLGGGRAYRSSFGVIDEGHDTKSVRSFCLRSRGRFFPAKGRGGVQVRDVVDERGNFFHDNQPISVLHFSDDDFKRDLYVGRIGEFERIREGVSPVPRLWLPVYPEAEFVDELCQEKRIYVKKRGRMVWQWADPEGPNDWGDAVKMLLVLWYKVGAFFTEDGPPAPKV